MVRVRRVASVPLILSDPYFSLWSPADHLYDVDVESWTGKKMPIHGYISYENETYLFMGKDEKVPVLPQTSLDILATQTIYHFSNEKLELELTFSTNLDLDDFVKISAPVTVISTKVSLKNGGNAKIYWDFSDDICYDVSNVKDIGFNQIEDEKNLISFIGKRKQSPLNSSGDLIDIDWGYFYLAAEKKEQIKSSYDGHFMSFSYFITNEETNHFLVAYDDIKAINYFGHHQNALWMEKFPSMYALLTDYLSDLNANLTNCQKINKRISEDAKDTNGETMEFLAVMSYRQAICAHKLIRDEENNLIFLSKECSSNGCIGTVDVSYPSIPLFLLYQPELVKGMMRPIYKFAHLPVWEYPFAPHDVGRYPYATGQVYSLNHQENSKNWSDYGEKDTIFSFFNLPKNQNVYDVNSQMPIEECGNMLLMASTLYFAEKDDKFLKEHMATNIKWADYLVKYGKDPDNQLCTDDFAGHMAHNTNLSLKAITGLALFGKALDLIGDVKGAFYREKAEEMAAYWVSHADMEDHTALAFDQPDTWSLKYNIIWDKLFDLGLFPEKMIQKDLQKYIFETNEYGVPLDNRATYTKADWIAWVAALSDDKNQQKELLSPLKTYLEESTSRVPFSDWYDTITGKSVSFKNRTVVGGIFMPILKDKLQNEVKETID